jgi:hypothetical protein
MIQQPVSVENDFLAMKVYPHLGGKVASIVDKSDRYELMFNYPAEIPTEPHYDVPYDDSWYAGWDECFPGIEAGPYPARPYENIRIPDHGELWGLPTTAVPTNNGITTVWHGLRFGYRLTRKLFLEGPSIVAQYTLINLSPFEFRFVWAQHALLSMVAPMELQLPRGSSMRLSHDQAGARVDRAFQWPTTSIGDDLSKPVDLPAKGGWKSYTADPIASAATVLYPSRGRKLTIEYAADEDGGPTGYWGLWINTGGWEGQKHVAFEASTGRYDGLDRSIEDGSAARVAPGGRSDWRTTWTCAAMD